MLVFLNGKFLPEADALVSVNDRGFLLGDGLFETMRVAERQTFSFCAASGTADARRGFSENQAAVHAEGAGKIRRAAHRQKSNARSHFAGDADARAGRARIFADKFRRADAGDDAASAAAADADEPLQWSLVTSSFRIPAGDALSSFKTTSKILNVLARDEAEEKGADEALLLNTNGEVAETAGGNLFWVYQDKICTVPSGRGVLPGITRAIVLEICQSLGLETNKRIIKPEHLRNAEGLFVTQSALGIVPVAAFDGEPVAPSPLVDQIASAYNEMLVRESA